MPDSYPGLPMSLHPGLTAAGYGTVVATRHYPSTDEHCAASHITVEQADPHILVTADLLHELAEKTSHLHPFARLESDNPILRFTNTFDRFCVDAHRLTGYRPPSLHPTHTRPLHQDHQCQGADVCWHSWLLHIDAANRHLVYRIGAYHAELNAWEATWPD